MGFPSRGLSIWNCEPYPSAAALDFWTISLNKETKPSFYFSYSVNKPKPSWRVACKFLNVISSGTWVKKKENDFRYLSMSLTIPP